MVSGFRFQVSAQPPEDEVADVIDEDTGFHQGTNELSKGGKLSNNEYRILNHPAVIGKAFDRFL